MADYTGKVRQFLTPVLSENGLELIDVSFTKEEGSCYLRVFIRLSEAEAARRRAGMLEASGRETSGGAAASELEISGAPEDSEREMSDAVPEPGVGIDDCVRISRVLSKWLDKEDLIKETYTLEVCSGGFLSDPST